MVVNMRAMTHAPQAGSTARSCHTSAFARDCPWQRAAAASQLVAAPLRQRAGRAGAEQRADDARRARAAGGQQHGRSGGGGARDARIRRAQALQQAGCERGGGGRQRLRAGRHSQQRVRVLSARCVLRQTTKLGRQREGRAQSPRNVGCCRRRLGARAVARTETVRD